MGELDSMVFVLTSRKNQEFGILMVWANYLLFPMRKIKESQCERPQEQLSGILFFMIYISGASEGRDWLKWHFLLGTSISLWKPVYILGCVSESKGRLTSEETPASTFCSALSEHEEPWSIYSRWPFSIHRNSLQTSQDVINGLQTVQRKSSTENLNF